VEIEIGKYYKRRDGEIVGPTTANGSDREYPFVCGDYTYTHGGRYHTYVEDPCDLVEECPAQGGAVNLQEVIAAKQYREGIALSVFPALISDFLKDVRIGSVKADVGESAEQWAIVAREAFAVADEFIKVANQP
jgi:hypothetical protein